MPYETKWIDPEIFITYRDVTIYHLYHGDDMWSGAKTYWFSTSIKGSEEGAGTNGEFDVRSLPTWTEDNLEECDVWDYAKDAICDAIDQGYLTAKKED